MIETNTTVTAADAAAAGAAAESSDAGICGSAPGDQLMRDTLARVGDKWTMLVIRELRPATLRFSELERRIPGISHRMLARTLRSLERDGLVSRTVYAEVPPRVEYALTPLGVDLMRPIRSMVEWVESNADTLFAHREEFDARASS